MKKILLPLVLLLSLVAPAQTDILDARTNYSPGDEVTVTGIILNGDEMGSVVRYIQDGTAGIAVFPGAWDSFTAPERGDEVTVTGILSEYNGLLEIGSNLSAVDILSSGNAVPGAQLIMASEAGESNEGELMMIDNVLFDNGGQVIAGNTTYAYTADGESGTIYLRNGSVLVGTMLPAGMVTLYGIMSQFSFNGDDGYQMLPRDADDFVLSSSINIIGVVNQGSIEYSTVELSWNTDSPGDSKIEWGLTPSLGTEVYDGNYTTAHTATVSGLAAGDIIYAQVSSSNGTDTTTSTVAAYATRSESSGSITVYFTQDVNTAYATDEEAISLGADVDDTIAAYISRAQHSIDIAMYNLGDPGIAAALNDAWDAGIQIRYVGEGTNTNAALDIMNDAIPYIMRTDGLGSGNHNKFCIIDADYVDLATVITGSMNWVNADQFLDFEDYNNIIIFQDQSLAHGYRIEFEEMWGGNGPEPDASLSVFGADKTNNTPKKYWIGNSLVESFFSPTDNTNAAVIKTIQTTDSELYYAMFAFTRDDVAAAVIDEDDLFLTDVKGLIEQTSDPSSEYQTLLDAGMEVFSTEQEPHLLHHKYCIVDPNDLSSDPTVLTGSHNWSSTANTINDENTVIVHDARVANLYYQEFMARWNSVGVHEVAEKDAAMTACPNPASNYLAIGIPAELGAGELTIVDGTGRCVLHQSVGSGKSVVSLDLPDGMYYCVLSAGGKEKTHKLVVNR